MRFLSSFVLLSALSVVLARKPVYRAGVDQLLGDIAYLDTRWSAGFTFWIQLLNKPVADSFTSLFKGKHQKQWTILMPNSTALVDYIEAAGGNTTDIEGLTTKEWRDFFTDLYPFFFVEGTLNTSAIAADETVVFDSWKKSPVGDWQLPIAFRRNPTFEPDLTVNGTFPYNGTFFFEPYGEANVTNPDYQSKGGNVAQLLNAVPIEPKNLSTTLAALDITSWLSITSRIPAVAALETSHDFTLLLPPSSSLSSALSLSDIDLAAFLDAHLVPERFVLSTSTNKTFTTVSGASGTVSTTEITVGDVTAKVERRDVLTNGIWVQVIDRPLTNLTSTSTTPEAHTGL
ncbi:hypothetical protein JCM8547_003603 [Rhodosporidiobolus lusitaniae]